MFAYLSRWGTRPRTTTRLRRVIAALAAVTGDLLAWAAAIPAASAATILIPDPAGAYGPVRPTPPTTLVQVITVGGIPGWQITLIVVGAALVAATATVLLDRARAAARPPPPPDDTPHPAPGRTDTGRAWTRTRAQARPLAQPARPPNRRSRHPEHPGLRTRGVASSKDQ